MVRLSLEGDQVVFAVIDITVPDQNGEPEPKKLLRVIDQQTGIVVDVAFSLEGWGKLTAGTHGIEIARTLPLHPNGPG